MVYVLSEFYHFWVRLEGPSGASFNDTFWPKFQNLEHVLSVLYRLTLIHQGAHKPRTQRHIQTRYSKHILLKRPMIQKCSKDSKNQLWQLKDAKCAFFLFHLKPKPSVSTIHHRWLNSPRGMRNNPWLQRWVKLSKYMSYIADFTEVNGKWSVKFANIKHYNRRIGD